MEILHALYRNVRTIAMPSGMVIGALLCRPIAALDAWSHHTITPALIFMMLFITFCRVEPRRMHLEPLHGWLLLFQVVVSLGVYFLLEPLNVILAQGAMICVLAPIAMAAVVIGGMLGGSITTMATYSLLCNMAIAVIAPAVLSVVGNGECSFFEIFRRIVPLLVGPFLAAQLLRAVLPKIAEWIGAHGQISFYMWLASLTIIIGRTMVFIMEYPDTDIYVEAAMAAVAGAICLLQFIVGRRLGRRYGDAVAGGQSLGQKNTVLAIWMAQSFMNPLSSIAPTAYIIWQNIVNSYQIYKHDRLKAEK
ncbi:MAG: transporter [Alistipes sp.]|nr:transporter [Alistipes sp.]